MGSNKLNRNTFNNDDKLNKVLNRDFSELVEIPIPTIFDPELATIEDLFNVYDRLAPLITPHGDTNTHEYLVRKSSEYLNTDITQDIIQALLDEINDLRLQLLELQNKNIKNTQDSISSEGDDKPLFDYQLPTQHELYLIADENQINPTRINYQLPTQRDLLIIHNL